MTQIQATPASSGTVTGSVTVTNLRVSSPTVSNVLVVTANTEETVTLPNNTVRFHIQARGNSKLKIRYVSGGDYLTIYPGAYYAEDNVQSGSPSLTLYIETSLSGETLEILSWS